MYIMQCSTGRDDSRVNRRIRICTHLPAMTRPSASRLRAALAATAGSGARSTWTPRRPGGSESGSPLQGWPWSDGGGCYEYFRPNYD